jgi:large subunit ribosomal protein L5
MAENNLVLTATDYYFGALEKVKQELPAVNPFALPKIEKIVINVGVGKLDNKQRLEVIDYLEKLTGQKPKVVKAKKSISGFKLRAGEINGVMVTLRGKKMLDFLLLLIYIALPRTRDFRGLSRSSFDEQYISYNIGIPNASIFPQIGFDSSVQFGMQVVIVFKTPGKNNLLLLQKLNFPFSKN